MTDQEFAVLYAKTECDQGDAQVEFLPDDKRVEVLNGIQGTEKDSALKNFAGTFGKCKVLQAACSPSFLPAWFNPTDTIMYDESVPTDTPTKFEAALNEYKNLCTTATESASDYIESCNKDFDKKSFKEQFLGFFGNKEYDNECAMKSNIESSLVTGIANVSGQVNNLNFDLKADSLNDMGKAVETLKSTLNTYSQNEPSEAQKDKLTKAQQDIGKAEAFLAAIKGAAAPEKFIKKDSILICTIGGVVHFVDDGQKEMEQKIQELIEEYFTATEERKLNILKELSIISPSTYITDVTVNDPTDLLNRRAPDGLPLNVLPATSFGPARSPEAYRQVLDSFQVDKAQRYQRTPNGQTYCNMFLWDATTAMGAEINHYIDEEGNPTKYDPLGYGKTCFEANANKMVELLNDHGQKIGWKKISSDEAINRANKGYPTAVAWENTNGIGHVAMVSPQTDQDKKENPKTVKIAQAGWENFNYDTVQRGFGMSQDSLEIEYWTHD